MGGFLQQPTWRPNQPTIPIGTTGQVLTVQAGGSLAFAAGGGGGGVGSFLAVAVAAGATNNANPTGFGTTVGRLDCTLTATSNWTGLAAGSDGQIVIVTNLSAFNFTLNNLNAGSAAANQFRGVADLILVQDDSVQLVYYAGTVKKWVITP